MRHWLVLAAIYAFVAALIVPGSLFAQEDVTAPEAGAPPSETAPAEARTPAAEPVDAAPAEPAPAEPAPAAPAPAAPAPAGPAPAPAVPAPAPAEQPASDDAAPALVSDRKSGARKRKKQKLVAVAAADTSVTISDFEFSPAQITVQAGDTVTWNNDGPTPHSATASGGSFDTGILQEGGTGSHTFDDAGTFAYICTPHPFMKGTVVVEAASTGGSGDSGATSQSDTGSTGSSSGSSSSDSGSSLPTTGIDAAALAILGLLMLALGVAIQRRSREPEPPRAG
jgi:LPXTG-motif cell wall-anchored protein